MKYALGVLGLSLGYDLGMGGSRLCGPLPLVGALLLLMGVPLLAFGGLMVGAFLGSRVDQLLAAQFAHQTQALVSRRWVVRCWGLVQCLVVLVPLLALTPILPLKEVLRQFAWLGVVWAGTVLGAAAVWLVMLKGWFELLTGVRFREFLPFWQSLSLWRKLGWTVVYYGPCLPLFLLPTLILMDLVRV